MDQELKKKYDNLRKTVQQERKKFEQDKKAMESEHKKLQKEKTANERTKAQIKQEREAWLSRQKKAKVSDAQSLYSKINKALKAWVKREVETKEEFVSIAKMQGEMKEESSQIHDEREKLEAEKEKFLQTKKEFIMKCEELDAQIKAGEGEQTRLKELEESYQTRDKQKNERDQECTRLSELLIVREQDVVEKGGKLDLERIQVDELKNSLHSALAEKRANFVKELSALSSEVLKWNCSFVDLFNGVAIEAAGETKQEEEKAVYDLEKKTAVEEYPTLDAATEAKMVEEYEVMKEPEPEPELEEKDTELNESKEVKPEPAPEKELKEEEPQAAVEKESTELNVSKEQEPEPEVKKNTELNDSKEEEPERTAENESTELNGVKVVE